MSSPSCGSLQHGAPRSHLLHPVNYYKGSDEGERAPKSSVKEKIISSSTAMSQPTPATMEPPVLPGETKTVFGVADIVVVVLYFVFVLAVGIWVSACGEWVHLCLGQHLILSRPFLGTNVSVCRRHPLHTPLSQAIISRSGRWHTHEPHPHMETTMGSPPGGCSEGGVNLLCCKVVSCQRMDRNGTKARGMLGSGVRRLKWDFRSFGKVNNYLFMLLYGGLFYRHLQCSGCLKCFSNSHWVHSRRSH